MTRGILIFAGALSFAPAAAGQCEYEVTVIQYPINCSILSVSTSATGLNEHGHVVGSYRCPIWENDQGFLWTPEGGYEPLVPPAGVIEVQPTDINDEGVICGTMIVSGTGYRGFVYDTSTGVWTELPPAVPGVGWSSAAAINNAGVVVGRRSLTKNLNPRNAFVWSEDSGFIDLGIPIEPGSSAVDISESGVVAGWSGTILVHEAFVWDRIDFNWLGLVPGGISSSPGEINSSNHIAGAGLVDDGQILYWQPFLLTDSGMTLLPMLAGYDGATARGLNALDVVVGQSNSSKNSADHRGVVWIGGSVHDLNALLVASHKYLIKRAFTVNHSGQIIADGRTDSSSSLSFLLSAVGFSLADLNGDCCVNGVDLQLLFTHWGTSGPIGDVDGNGAVNIRDLLLLLANWG